MGARAQIAVLTYAVMRRTPRYEIRLAAPLADNRMNSVAHCVGLLWAFCVLGLCRKNVLWDTKFATNNVQKGEYGSIGKKLALRYSF